MKDLAIFNQFAKESNKILHKTDGKGVIYTRVSTKEQADTNASLETQKKYCEKLAKTKNIDIVAYFGGTYESAKSDERKEFQRMLNFVKKKKEISYIIVYSYDRFSRTGANGAYISDQLKKRGVITISATQQVDVSTSSGAFQQNLYYMFSQFDNELRRDKSVSGMQEKLRRGEWTGAWPFGYENKNPGKGKKAKFVINKKGEALKQAFLWKANEQLSHVEISHRLKRKGVCISDKKLSDYFRNPFYCGLLVNSLIPGEVIEGIHEPMISKEIFLKVNNLLFHREEGYKYTLEDENLPLKVFLKSTTCGTPCTGFVVKKKGLYYYKNRRKGSRETRSAKKLHDEFFDVLRSLSIGNNINVEPLKEIIEKTFISMNQDIIENKIKLEKEILVLQEQLEQMDRRYVVLGEISKEQYDIFRPQVEKEKLEKEQFLQKTGINSSNFKKSVNLALQYATNLASLWRSGDIETKRSLQNMVFPEGIGYDFKNKRVQTFRVNEVFKLIHRLSSSFNPKNNGNCLYNFDNSRLVTAKGFKPPTLRAEI